MFIRLYIATMAAKKKAENLRGNNKRDKRGEGWGIFKHLKINNKSTPNHKKSLICRT